MLSSDEINKDEDLEAVVIGMDKFAISETVQEADSNLNEGDGSSSDSSPSQVHLTDDEQKEIEEAILELENDLLEINDQMDECEEVLRMDNEEHPPGCYFSLWVPGYGYVSEAKYEEIYGQRPDDLPIRPPSPSIDSSLSGMAGSSVEPSLTSDLSPGSKDRIDRRL
ncbi:hypothetical protein ACOME3_006796 [Neoechinorhynchus agilis]